MEQRGSATQPPPTAWEAGPTSGAYPGTAPTRPYPFLSRRFRESRANVDLAAVAQGRMRLGRPGDPPYPAPIRSQGLVVQEVQQALMDLGYPLPWFRADGRYGNETYGVVMAYKRQCNIRTTTGYLDGVVGPRTICYLDAALAACPALSPPPSYPPGPGPKPPDPPDPRPKPPMAVVTRRNAWDLEAKMVWDPVSLGYARAVRAMMGRPPSDPTSWGFQAAMHGTEDLTNPEYNKCQHQTWYFLPWHRMFLYFFERIVRATVIQQGGPTDWALPYWNYSDNPRQRPLPRAFIEGRLPDGSPNPLRIQQRNPGFNSGEPLHDSVVHTDSLDAMDFSTTPGGSFGGNRTSPQHEGERAATGRLESEPHNNVHFALGGYMGRPDQAARDPIFWLHHANIDRLWTVWLRQGGGRQNPSDAEWLDQRFFFFDEGGRRTAIAVRDVLDTRLLGYRYDDPPAPAAEALEARAAVKPPVAQPPKRPRPAPRILSSGPGIQLAGTRRLVDHSLGVSAKQVVSSIVAAPSRAPRMILRLEGVTFDRDPGVLYQVYLNPQEAPGSVHHQTPHFVGILSFFRRGGRSGEGGMTQSFDITDAVRDLRLQGRWDESKVSVGFAPIKGVVHAPGSPAAMKPLPTVPVHVRSIKIHSG